MYVAADNKNWDTYLPSATFAYNTSLSETTDNTPFFLTCGHESVKLPNVALLLPLVHSNSVVYITKNDSFGKLRQLDNWLLCLPNKHNISWNSTTINLPRIILSV